MGRRVVSSLPATTQITNGFSSGGVSITSVNGLPVASPLGVKVSSGVGTANTLVTLLSVNGAGWVPLLTCFSNSATPAHTVRCQVLVDGVAVFDATSDTITTTANRGFFVVNSAPAMAAGASWGVSSPIRFNSSLEVKACSSQSGTDYVAILYQLDRTAN